MAKAAEVVLQLRAENAQYLTKLRQSEAQFKRSLGNIQRQAGATGAFLRTTFASLGLGISVVGFQKIIDASTQISNALKVAGLSGDDLTRVYDRLFASAQKNAAPLESLVTLYGRAAIVQKELGVSTEELLTFTDNVSLALRVAGTDAQTASGALLQLSQALGSGVVRAEEFNSILEGALPIAQAAAAGLKEAGGSVAKLRGLIVDGKVSSEAFFRAFEAGSVILKEKVVGAELTLSQRLVRLQNVLIASAGKFDEASKASKTFGGGIDSVATTIENFDWTNFFQNIDAYIRKAGEAKIASENWARSLGQALGLDAVGEFLTNNDVANALGLSSGRAINRRMGGDLPAADSVIQDWARRNYGETATTATTGRLPAKPAANPTVTIDQFPVVGGNGSKGKGGRRNEWERETAQIKERTAALQAETAAMAGLNPLVNDYGFALEFAAAKQELLSAAKAAGLEITPELSATIDDLAGKYANAGVQAEILAESQDAVRERAEEMRDLGKDVFGGFISDMVQGKSAADALADALGKIGDKLLDIAMNSLFDGGGILGSLFGGGFGTRSGFADMLGVPGRASGGPVSAGQPYIVGERRPELFVPNQSGRIIPSVPKLSSPGGVAGGGSIVVQFSPSIDNRGASVEAVAQTAQQLAKMKAELPAMVIQAVRQAKSRNVKFG